jgi:hypothetical protein
MELGLVEKKHNVLLKGLLETSRLEECRRTERIKMMFTEIACEKGRWIKLAQNLDQWPLLVQSF